MDSVSDDVNRNLMLDGNAAAGLLREIFGTEMTVNPAECAHCGNIAAIAELLAFMQGPGVVLRCPGCEEVILRIVQTPDTLYFDMRGAAYIQIHYKQ